MSDNLNIYQKCTNCKGSGTITINNGIYEPGPPQIVNCSWCNGTGELYWGRRAEEATNVFDSYLILEAIDATEYNALTDVQKDGVKVLLSCGKVDLNTGKAGIVRLTNWFGAESTTVANITALIT